MWSRGAPGSAHPLRQTGAAWLENAPLESPLCSRGRCQGIDTPPSYWPNLHTPAAGACPGLWGVVPSESQTV